MFKKNALATAAVAISLLSSVANSAVIGMLYIGEENKAGLAVEKTANGEIYLLLDIDGNQKRVEYGVSPGTPFGGRTVVTSADGIATAVLSIYSGEKDGLVNSPNVSIVDAGSGRTHQRTSLSQDLKDLAEGNYLTDDKGKVYSAAESRKLYWFFKLKTGPVLKLI